MPQTVALKPMDPRYIVWLYLWIGPHLLLAILAVILFRKGWHKTFPIFFTYLVFEFLQFCVLFSIFAISRWQSVSVLTYAKMELLGRAGSVAFRFGVIREMFEVPAASCPPLRKTLAGPLNTVTVILVGLASVFIGALYLGDISRAMLPAYVIDEALNTVQCGLLALVFGWFRFLRVRMPGMVFGIALGMGLVSGFEPLLHALRYRFGESSSIPNFLAMAVFHVSVLIWIFFAVERKERASDSGAVSFIDVRGWNAELGRFLQP